VLLSFTTGTNGHSSTATWLNTNCYITDTVTTTAATDYFINVLSEGIGGTTTAVLHGPRKLTALLFTPSGL
jgi:hypothetical protein